MMQRWKQDKEKFKNTNLIIQRKYDGTKIIVKGGTLDDIADYGITSYYFLIPFRTQVTGEEFIDMIEKFSESSCRRTQAVLNSLRNIVGTTN